jgi:hypothetical protein
MSQIVGGIDYSSPLEREFLTDKIPPKFGLPFSTSANGFGSALCQVSQQENLTQA